MRAKIIIALVLMVLAALSVFSCASFFSSSQLVLEKDALREGELIAVKIEVQDSGVHLGDAVSYKIKVVYRSDQIEIDKTSLDKTIDFKPFEIRTVKERELNLSSNTKMYVREYKIQLLDGEENRFYVVPAAGSVGYKLKDSGLGHANKAELPKTRIFVDSRLPSDAGALQLKPLLGKAIDERYQSIPRALIGFGILFLVSGILFLVLGSIRIKLTKTELISGIKKIFKGFRGKEKETEEELKDLFDGLLKLEQRALRGEDPKILFHQTYQTLRTLLNRKEGIDWLEDLKPESISLEIRQPVLRLLERCQNSYGPEPPEMEDVQNALRELRKILDFYLH